MTAVVPYFRSLLQLAAQGPGRISLAKLVAFSDGRLRLSGPLKRETVISEGLAKNLLQLTIQAPGRTLLIDPDHPEMLGTALAELPHRVFIARQNILVSDEVCRDIAARPETADLIKDYGEFFVHQACAALASIIGAEAVQEAYRGNPFFFSRVIKIILQMGHRSGRLDFAINYEELREIIPPALFREAFRRNMRDTVMAFFYIDYLGRDAQGRLRFLSLHDKFKRLFPAQQFSKGFFRRPVDTILAYEHMGIEPEIFYQIFAEHKFIGKKEPAEVFRFSYDEFPVLRQVRIAHEARVLLDETYALFVKSEPKQAPLSVVDDAVAQIPHLVDAEGKFIDVGQISYLGLRVNNARDRGQSCPLACVYCDQEGSETRVSLEVWKKLIVYATQNGQRRGVLLNISGGEPTTLGLELIELIKFAKARNMFVSMNTSAFLIDDDFAAELVRSGLDNVNISLDSANYEIHDQIVRKAGAWDKTTYAIRLLHKHRCREQSALRIAINTVLTRQNIREFKNFVQAIGERFDPQEMRHHIDDINPLPVKIEAGKGEEWKKQSGELLLTEAEIERFIREDVPEIVTLAERFGYRLLGRKIQEIYGRTPEERQRAAQGIYYPRYDFFPCYTSAFSLYAAASTRATPGGGALVRLSTCSYAADHTGLNPENAIGVFDLSQDVDLTEIRRAHLRRLNELPGTAELCARFCGSDIWRLNHLIAVKLAAQDRRLDLASRQAIDKLADSYRIDQLLVAELVRQLAQKHGLPVAKVLSEHSGTINLCLLRRQQNAELLPEATPGDVLEAANRLGSVEQGLRDPKLSAEIARVIRKRKTEALRQLRLSLDAESRMWITRTAREIGIEENEVAALCRAMVEKERLDIGLIIRNYPDQVRSIAEFAAARRLYAVHVYEHLLRRGVVNFASYLRLHGEDVTAAVSFKARPQITTGERSRIEQTIARLARKYDLKPELVRLLLATTAKLEHLTLARLVEIDPDPVLSGLRTLASGESESLRNLSQQLLSTSDLDMRMALILDGLQQITGPVEVFFSLLDPDKDMIFHAKKIEANGTIRNINIAQSGAGLEVIAQLSASARLLINLDPALLQPLGLDPADDSNQRLLLVPLRDASLGKTVAFMTVITRRQLDRQKPGTRRRLDQIEVLAGQVAPAVTAGLLQQQQRSDLTTAQELYSLTRLMANASLEELIAKLPEFARTAAGCARARLLLYSSEEQRLRGELYPKNQTGDPMPVDLLVDQRTARLTPLARAIFYRRPELVEDVTFLPALTPEQVGRLGPWFDFQRPANLLERFEPFVVLPLLDHERKVLAVLVLDNLPQPDKPTERPGLKLPLLEQFIYSAGLALEKVMTEHRLKEMSIIDELTGLFNYRHLTESFPKNIERCAREGVSFLVGLVDIDKFKRFNDYFNYSVGNLALQHVVRCLNAKIRKADLLFRQGGEEFLLFGAVGGEYQAARDLPKIADNLRQGVAEKPFKFVYGFGGLVKTLARMLAAEAFEPQRPLTVADVANVSQQHGLLEIEGAAPELVRQEALTYYQLFNKLSVLFERVPREDLEALTELVLLAGQRDSVTLETRDQVLDLLRSFGVEGVRDGVAKELTKVMEREQLAFNEDDLTLTMRVTISGVLVDRETLTRRLLSGQPVDHKKLAEQLRFSAVNDLLTANLHQAKSGGRNRIIIVP